MQNNTLSGKNISRLERLRIALGLTQREFGNKIGMASNSISQVESGRRGLTNKTVLIIGSKFPQVNTEWLLDGKGEMFLNRPDPQGSPIEGLGLTQLEMADIAVEARADAMRSEPDWKGEALRLERENKSKQRQIDMLLELLAEERSRK